MKLQTQLEKWQCCITSFAMAMDMPVTRLIELAGHDGGAIAFPSEPEPKNRRGHNVYEMIRRAIDMGLAVTPVPLHPSYKPHPNSIGLVRLSSEKEDWELFTDQINTSRGVIECTGPRGNHMVAYHYGRIYDPRGIEFQYTREECEAQFLFTFCLWRVDRI